MPIPMRFTWTSGLFLLLAGTHFALAAEQPSAARQSAAGDGWSSLGMGTTALALIAALALVWFARKFYSRRALDSRNDPRHLLHELCQAHGLSRRAERLLRKASAAVGTPHPARFFLEPQLLLQAHECEQLRSSRRALGLLYERLFGEELG
jgi:hypothetical protein